MDRAARYSWRDLAVAAPLAAVMSAGWAWARWPALRAGILPDTDDLMRLQQIRDWLNGQDFSVLTQERLGVNGVAMHWSRLPDLVPAGIIATLRPILGTGPAELVALLVWPALLLAAFLAGAAALARGIGARPVEAMIVAVLAYPATSVFAPGRIDHHNLQLVLLLAVATGLIGRSTRANGVLAGVASVLSVATGMETVPAIGVGIAAALVRWTTDRGQDPRIAGLAVALALGAVTSLVLASDGWLYPACDGFDRQSWGALTIAAAAIVVLAFAGPRLTVRGRMVAVAAAGVTIVAAIALVVPTCLSPYGAVDPMLARAWLSQVAEAQGLFVTDPRWAIAYLGLPVAGAIAGIAAERRDPCAERRLLLAIALAALALSAVQIRAAYAGAAVAVPLLAEAIDRMRRRGLFARLATRIAATGIVYPLLAAALPIREPMVAATCDTAAALSSLRRLPSARVLAPIDDGPVLIATTRHKVLAGPYHRNAAGNLAALRFDTARPDERRRILRDLRIDYRVGCEGDGMRATGVPALWRTR